MQLAKIIVKHYKLQLDQLNHLMDQFTTVVTQWISERENHGAHNLANQALQRLE